MVADSLFDLDAPINRTCPRCGSQPGRPCYSVYMPVVDRIREILCVDRCKRA